MAQVLIASAIECTNLLVGSNARPHYEFFLQISTSLFEVHIYFKFNVLPIHQYSVLDTRISFCFMVFIFAG
jgi:hypothetical protein